MSTSVVHMALLLTRGSNKENRGSGEVEPSEAWQQVWETPANAKGF